MRLTVFLFLFLLSFSTHASLQNSYLILLQGGGDEREFVLDLKNVYRFTKEVGLPIENVFVFSDAYYVQKTPLDLDADGIADSMQIYTETGLEQAVRIVGKKLTSQPGQLIIYASSHGDYSPKTLLDIATDYNEPALFVDHLKAMLDHNIAPHVQISLVLDACYSGGFGLAIASQNRFVFTAAPENEKSPSSKISGGYFTNAFFDNLREQGLSFKNAFANSLDRRGMLRFSNMPYEPRYYGPTNQDFILGSQ